MKLKINLILIFIILITISIANTGDMAIVKSMFVIESNQIKDVYVDGNSYWCIAQDGSVFVMGKNEYGQLGLGNTNEANSVYELVTDALGNTVSEINKIIGNDKSIYYLSANGEVYVSGRNSYGQLGLGHTNDVLKITKVKGAIENVRINKIVTDGCSLFCISDNGEVYVSGLNNYGQLGLGGTSNIKTITKLAGAIEGVKIIDVVSNNRRTYFLDETGAVYVSGYDPYLQLKETNLANVNKVSKLNGVLSGVKIVKIIAGESTYYLSENGEVYVSGLNNYGQLGLGIGENVSNITKLSGELIDVKIAKIIAGESTYYISDTGVVYVSGKNDNGQLGLGHSGNVVSATKLLALEGKSIKNIVATGASTYYIAESGEVYVSGNNEYGQLGLDDKRDIDTATKLTGIMEGVKINNILNDRNSTYYIAESGEVYVSGNNNYGQLGLGHNTSLNTIVKSEFWTSKQLKDIKNEKYISTNNIYTLISDINNGANQPELYGGLYPIKYSEAGEVIFTTISDPEWYNYTEGKWANAVTLDIVGQRNPDTATEANITGYYVWVPRYAYLIRTGYNSSETGMIDIRFLNGTTNTDKDGNTYYTINDLDNASQKWEGPNTLVYMGDRQIEYLVHPAFYFEEELAGLWVGKYQAKVSEKADFNRNGKVDEEDIDILNEHMWSHDEEYDLDGNGGVSADDLGILISIMHNKSEVLTTGEAHQNVTVGNAFGAIRNMNSTSENYDKYNSYGLKEDVNTHLIKATEYGAVVYLADSKYGGDNYYKVDGIDSGKEYMAGYLVGTTDLGELELLDDKYKKIYSKDGEGNIIDQKGSAYLETSDGITAWDGQSIINIDETNGVIVKEGAYGIVANDGQATDVGFRVALTKGINKNKIKKVYVNNNSYCWLMDNGEVWVMGENSYGQLGVGDKEYRHIPERLEVDKSRDKIPAIKDIVVGSNNIFYIGENGAVYASGYNSYGQFGLGNQNDYNTAIKISELDGVKIKEIVNDMYSTWYISDNGEVYVSGDNSYGRLGLGNTSAYKDITKISALDGVKIKEVIISSYSAWYLSEEGEVYVSGRSEYGQLGMGGTSNQLTATKITALDGITIKKIIIQGYNAYYISESGEVYVSGRNSYGELGVGGTSNQLTATKITALDGIKIENIIGDSIHAFYISESGEVYVGGYNRFGELGIGNTSNQSIPVKISALEGKVIVDIITDSQVESVWYLSEEGEVYVSGRNDSSQLGVGGTSHQLTATKINSLEAIKIKQIITTPGKAYYISEDDKVYVSGGAGFETATKSDFWSKIGIEKELTDDIFLTKDKKIYTTAEERKSEKLKIKNTNDLNIKEIINYVDSTWYLTEEGEVYVSGKNSYGQLGVGNTTNQLSAIKIKALEGVKIKEVICCDDYSSSVYYLSEEGEVYVSGLNQYGQLGLGHENNVIIPTKISALDGVKVKQIMPNNRAAWYLSEEGEVYVSGRNSYGQLGTGNKNNVITATKILEGIRIKEIIIGNNAYYITEEGEVYVSGYNNRGSLGVGHANNQTTPVKVSALNGTKINKVIFGSANTYYINENGEVYASGFNSYGQLGVGSTNDVTTATKISALNGIKITEVIRDGSSTWYRTEEGEVYVSGRNDYGQLGLGNTDDQTTPQKISALRWLTITDIILDEKSVYYLTDRGKVYVSGDNTYGRLGIGDTNNVTTAIKINALNSVEIEKIIIKGYSTYYISNNGDVYVSGYNSYGQLGVGTTSNVKTATKISALDGVSIKDIESNGTIQSNGTTKNYRYSTYYLSDNGEVYVSGYNSNAQLGIGNKSNLSTPAKLDSLDGIKIIKIKNAENSTYYLDENGKAYVSGYNVAGELAQGHTSDVLVPSQIVQQDASYSTLLEVNSIYGNSASTVFEQENGDIYVIGDNTNSKLGIIGSSKIEMATKIDLKDIKDAGIGSDFSVFLKDDGNIVGYGNSAKNGNGLIDISQIAVQNNKAYFKKENGTVIDNYNNVIITNAYKIAAGDNHLVVLLKDGTTKSFGQADSGLIDVVNIFAGKNMTVFITSDGKTHLMENDTLTTLTLKNIVYAELNGSQPYFLNYNRKLLNKDGGAIEILGADLTWVKEVKGNVVLNERMNVYDLSKL